jgi:hypothetical protein
MNCENASGDQILSIISGEDKTFMLRIIDAASQIPFDLTNASAIDLRLKKADNTVLVVSLGAGVTVESALGGKIQVVLPKTSTALLNVRDRQDFEVEITIGTGNSAVLTVVQFLKVLSVKARVV